MHIYICKFEGTVIKYQVHRAGLIIKLNKKRVENIVTIQKDEHDLPDQRNQTTEICHK